MKLRFRKEIEESPHIMRIPKRIQEDIEKKGFHLYKWISPNEVKLSIERDFLKSLSIVGMPLAIISVLAGLLSGFNIVIFFITISLGVFGIFIYLFFLSLYRSSLLSKSAFVVLTDSSISLGGKVKKLSEISQLKDDIKQVSETFEEELFEDSKLHSSKASLQKKVTQQIFSGYEKIFKSSNNTFSRDSKKGILLILALYTLYLAVMACVYFIGVLFLLVLGNIFVWINKKYLIWKGQNILKINEIFRNLDILSEEVHDEKNKLTKYLKKAQNNEWKDGLLLEINTGIQQVNNSALGATEQVTLLKKEIKNSQHSDMFSFEVYHGWIKSQITMPLLEIKILLTNTQTLLLEQKNTLKGEKKGTKKADLIGALTLQEKRIDMQLSDIKKFLPLLEKSIKKLEK